MGSHDQQLRNPRYRDWVKAGLALKYLKDGIEDFVNDETKEQQKNILAEVQREIGHPGATCNSCPIDQLRAYKQGRYKKSNRCPNDVCDRIFDKIAEKHIYGRPSWSNTDSTKWCTDYWEIAKCFIDGGGYGDKTTAADTDCKGLLSIITNSMFVQRHVDTPIDRFEPKTDVFSKSKEARNEILHLASLQLPAETLKGYIDVMIQILEDKGRLHENENAKQAIAKLRQLKETDLFISTEDEWETRKSALKAVQERKQEALEAIEKKQNEIIEKLQIDKIQETLDDLSKTSKETSQSFSNRHESLEQRQTVLESTLKQTQKLQKETSQAVEQLQQDVRNLKTDLSDLKARFDAFHEVELQHKKRVTYLDHKKGIRQELFNMYSKYLSNIPVPPLLQKLDATVDEFYMELKICDDLVYEKKGSSENYYYRKPVTNYHEIFYKKGKRIENIYVLGDAGVGKTTWCLKMIHTWLQGLTTQEAEATHSLSPNEKMMLEFDFVLFVSLRHASKDANITDMIRNQIFHQTPQLLEHMQEALDTEPDKCLVIADGLDEWNALDNQIMSPLGNDSSFPSRKNMNHCTVLTTTRPWKLNVARPSYSLIDRAVMIRGFGGDDCVSNLAEMVIHKLNQNVSHETSQEKNEKKVENFEQELYKRFPRPMFGNRVTQIPLILIIMVVKWFNDDSLESTMAGNYSFMLKSMLEHEEGYRSLKPKFGQKQKLDGRLTNIPYIEEAKREWSTDAEKLPECVKKHSVCCQYSRLILKLSEIAFEGLFDRNDKALIFSEDRLLEKLSSEEVEVAVVSGILSKSDVVGTCNVSKLSFLHKTVQEFLAAIHLAANHENDTCNSFQKFEKYCSKYGRIDEMENVILFISGLDANLTVKILKHVAKVENQEMYVRHSDFTDFVFKCIKELREILSVSSMQMVPLNSFIPKTMKRFDELLDLLDTFVDKGSIKYVEVKMLGEQGLRPNRLLDILSSEMCPLFNLTTLKLGHISKRCLYTRTIERVIFSLHNLRNLELRMINTNSIAVAIPDFVLDFTHCRNIKNVNLYLIFSCKIDFSVKTLKHLNLEQLKHCHVDINIDVSENKQIIPGNENGKSLTQSAFQSIYCICLKKCSLSNIGVHLVGENGKTSSMVAQIVSLTCEQSTLCDVEVDPRIHIESVNLISSDVVPKVSWNVVKTVVLVKWINVLDRTSCLQNITYLQRTTSNQHIISELLKRAGSSCNFYNLENEGNKRSHTVLIKNKHLVLEGSELRQIEENGGKNEIIIFSSVETLELSGVLPTPKNGIEFIQSLVNLKCINLKCHRITKQDFIMLGSCFKYLSQLEELDLSFFSWESVKSPSLFSCLEKIPNLKSLSLRNFSQKVMSEISVCFPNLSLTELLLTSSFSSVILCHNNKGKLKEELTFRRPFRKDTIQEGPFRLGPTLRERFLRKGPKLREGPLREDIMHDAILMKNLTHIQSMIILCPFEYSGNNTVQRNKNNSMINIGLSEFAHLKYILVLNDHICSDMWHTYVNSLPKNGQLETLQFQNVVILEEEMEPLIKSTPGFVCKEWKRVGHDTYNITLKVK